MERGGGDQSASSHQHVTGLAYISTGGILLVARQVTLCKGRFEGGGGRLGGQVRSRRAPKGRSRSALFRVAIPSPAGGAADGGDGVGVGGEGEGDGDGRGGEGREKGEGERILTD